jgi:DNA polymerase III subunit beta
MKFSINQTEFLSTVSAAAKVSGGLANHSFASHIKLIAAGSRVEAIGTNLECMLIAESSAEVAEPGELLVSGKLMTEILGAFTDDKPIRLERTGDNRLLVQADRVKYDLHVLKGDDFPPIPSAAKDSDGCMFPRFEVPGSILLPLLRRVGIAGDQSDQGFMALKFEAISVEPANRSLCARATDSKRAAIMGIPCPDLPVDCLDRPYLIPLKAAEDICRSIAAQPNCQVTVFSTKTQIGFSVGPITVITRLVDRKFPDIDRVFLKASNGAIQCQADDMAKALRSVRAVAGSSMVTFTINPQLYGDTCQIEATDSEAGSAQIAMPAKVEPSAEPIQIAFNLKYIEAMLALLKGKEITMAYTKPAYPAEFREVGDQAPRPFRYVIMPMAF